MKLAASLTIAAACALLAAPAAGQPPTRGRPAPARLADTGLYASWTERTVRRDNLPFSPQYPLWSDGASKRRWIHIPAGRWVDASRPAEWQFPVGTRFWKELAFSSSSSPGRPVETRYLERLPDGSWLFATYRWSQDGTEAELVPEQGAAAAHEVRPGLSHRLPSVADCRACHEGKPVPVLGFDALQLSWERDPHALHAEGDGETATTDLRQLIALGLVRGLPRELRSHPPRIASESPRTRAALGYLHANCGGCHNRSGPLAPLGLSLASPWPAAAAAMTSARHLVPGHPHQSPLLERMRSRHPIRQMPPLGTQLVDEEAVALLERWIAVDLASPDIALSAKPTPSLEDRP